VTTIINLLDDDTRPKAPKIEGVTPDQRRAGRRLALIHQLYLREIEAVEEIARRIEAGEAVAAEMAAAASGLQMADNLRLFGNLCGAQCEMLTVHHTIEDHELFPRLRGGSEGLRKVVDRLAQEHEVIHAIIDRLENEARAVLETPDAGHFAALRETFGLLAGIVRSHFGYEQSELEEAIGYHGVPM